MDGFHTKHDLFCGSLALVIGTIILSHCHVTCWKTGIVAAFWQDRNPFGCNSIGPSPKSLKLSPRGKGQQFATCCKTLRECRFAECSAQHCSDLANCGWCVEMEEKATTPKGTFFRRSTSLWCRCLCFRHAAANITSRTSTATCQLAQRGRWLAMYLDSILLQCHQWSSVPSAIHSHKNLSAFVWLVNTIIIIFPIIGPDQVTVVIVRVSCLLGMQSLLSVAMLNQFWTSGLWTGPMWDKTNRVVKFWVWVWIVIFLQQPL